MTPTPKERLSEIEVLYRQGVLTFAEYRAEAKLLKKKLGESGGSKDPELQEADQDLFQRLIKNPWSWLVALLAVVTVWQVQLNIMAIDIMNRAKAVGWKLEIDGYPYSYSEVIELGNSVGETERLKQRVSKLEQNYARMFPFPYEEPQIELYESLSSSLIPSGSFKMGCTPEQDDCAEDEQPVHEVKLSSSFYMMKEEVTQKFWKEVTGENPSHFVGCGADCPVEQVSWVEAIEFSNALNEQLGLESCYETDGDNVMWSKGYACTGWRLPTEAEWEHAARGAAVSVSSLEKLTWHKDNSQSKTHPVCQKEANGFGLCDMSGNVFEWVWDWNGMYASTENLDPKGPDSGLARSCRGGSWRLDKGRAQVYSRSYSTPSSRRNDLGFRLCRSVAD